VVELAQQPAVKRTSAVLGAPILVAALGAADGVPIRGLHGVPVRRDEQTARVRRGHLAAPLAGATAGPEEVGTMRLLLRLNELLLARVTAVAQRRWHHNSITSGAAVVTVL
jgi:hypothetical protein